MSGAVGEELIRAAGLAAFFLAVFAAAEMWRRFGDPEPEWTRKLVHVAGGTASLGLPWLVGSHWTVLALGISLALLLVSTRRLGLLDSVHGVERRSEGAVYFPVAVYLVFLLAADQPAFYLVSILTLVSSDALAALVGTTYGRLLYRVESGRRSLEGSAVFLLATFLAVHLPLLLMTNVDRLVSVLVALQIAVLVTIVEAISLEGLDNLLVPIGTYLLLLRLTPLPAETLFWQLVAQFLILTLLFLLVWRLQVLTAAGTLAASLFLYGVWMLGGPAWLAPPAAALIVFGIIIRLAAEFDHGPVARYQVLAVFYATLVPAAALIVSDVLATVVRHPRWVEAEPLYPLFAGALAGHLGLLCLVFWEGTPWIERVRPGRAIGSVMISTAAVLPVAYVVHPVFTPVQGLIAAALPALALTLYLLANRYAGVPRKRVWDGRLQAACVGASALTIAPLILVS